MDIESILALERTVCSLDAGSKKRAIEYAAGHIVRALPGLDINDVYRRLIEREKLGTTAIGKGVALPHCRIKSGKTIVGGLFTLARPIDFLAPDDEPVEIMFVLLVPESETTEHLETLATLAKRFEQATYRRALTTATSDAELFARAIAPIDDADTVRSLGG